MGIVEEFQSIKKHLLQMLMVGDLNERLMAINIDRKLVPKRY
jgi:hypothetical protein